MATVEELSNRYFQMSQFLIRQGQEELDEAEDYPQSSEKAWGAVAEALKAVAVGRNWNHHSHGTLRDVSTQLHLEFGRPRISYLFDSAEALHTNFYENRLDREQVQLRIDGCRELLDELERIRTSPPRRYTSATQEQRRRLERLTRRSPTVTAEEAAIDITVLPQV